MSRVLVSGSLAYDRIMDFPGLFKDHFLPDKLHNISVSFSVEKFTENFGGTAGNVAYSLSLLGIQPTIISTAGSDFERYSAYLRSLKIDPASIHIAPDELTSTAFIVTDKADSQIAAFSLAAGGKQYLPLPATNDASCALIGAGSPPDIRAFPAHYRTARVPYFYDPAQSIPVLSSDDIRDGITGSAAVFGNDYEFKLMAEKTSWEEATMLEHAELLVITLGEKGTRIVTREGETSVPAVKVPTVVDPTGAGDAYRAGFMAGWLAKLSPETNARIGSTVAAYAIENYGTQNHLFTMRELAERYTDAYGEKFPLR